MRALTSRRHNSFSGNGWSWPGRVEGARAQDDENGETAVVRLAQQIRQPVARRVRLARV